MRAVCSAGNTLRKSPPQYFRVTDWSLACNVSGAISNADVGLLGYELEKTCVKHVVFNPPRKAEGVGCVPTTSSNYVLSFVRQIIISSCFTDVT